MTNLKNQYQTNSYKRLTIILFCSFILMSILFISRAEKPVEVSAQGATTYYISPSGNDNNSGITSSEPWSTFDRAWEDLNPGDTLILMDGVYYQIQNHLLEPFGIQIHEIPGSIGNLKLQVDALFFGQRVGQGEGLSHQ